MPLSRGYLRGNSRKLKDQESYSIDNMELHVTLGLCGFVAKRTASFIGLVIFSLSTKKNTS